MTRRLNQVVAAEATVKASTAEKVTKLLRVLSKPELFGGMTKTYVPLVEGDETLPPEERRLQANVPEVLQLATDAWSELLDTTLTKDHANCNATASVEVDGTTLLDNVPVVYLLFLEKRVHDFATLVGKIPVLDPAYDWKKDEQGLYRTDPIKTNRTRKDKEALTLFAPTEHHPGQAEVITVDKVVGHYELRHVSGGITHAEKRRMTRNCEKLLRAIKEAREQANMTEAPAQKADGILDFIFGAKETA